MFSNQIRESFNISIIFFLNFISFHVDTIDCIEHKSIKEKSTQGDVDFLLLSFILKILENINEIITNRSTGSAT